MGDKTKIEWADATWNPVTGCTKVSPGCDHCYIDRTSPFRQAGRRFTSPGHDETCRIKTATAWDRTQEGIECTCPSSDQIGASTGVLLHPERLDQPLRWKRPRRVFVNSLSDLFHDAVPDEYIARVFAVMALAPQHRFMVLTKRHGRMRSLLNSEEFWTAPFGSVQSTADNIGHEQGGRFLDDPGERPLKNVWLGVTVEDQKRADLRIPALLDTPAAVRFLSCEPLLGPVDLTGNGTRQKYWLTGRPGWGDEDESLGIATRSLVVHPRIDWVICGGESGPDARPMHPNWARQIRDQCVSAGIPFHFKQWGEWAPDERIDEDGDRHVGRKPEVRDPKSLVMHPAGMTALTPDNPFDPWERGHPDWHTVMRRVGKRNAGRELDGRTWNEEPGADS